MSEKECVYLLTKLVDRRSAVAPNGDERTFWTHLKPNSTVKTEVGKKWRKKKRKKKKTKPKKQNKKKKQKQKMNIPPKMKWDQTGCATLTFSNFEIPLNHLWAI